MKIKKILTEEKCYKSLKNCGENLVFKLMFLKYDLRQTFEQE